MDKTQKLYIFLALLHVAIANSFVEFDGMVSISLMHALDRYSLSSFSERGNFNITSLRLGLNSINQNVLSANEQKLLRDMATENTYYHVKAIVNGQDGNSNSFKSYIKACMLAEAELTDIITVTLDYNGNVISVADVVASTSTCEGATVGTDRLHEFTTTVHVRHTYNGPSPDTAAYIQKLDRHREAIDRGEVKDNRSFLAKYWIYIVPVVIVMVLTSVTNQEAPNNAGR